MGFPVVGSSSEALTVEVLVLLSLCYCVLTLKFAYRFFKKPERANKHWVQLASILPADYVTVAPE